ncbi:hypothetical protein GQ457_04G019440 [Hibiscus cannabinus]
MFDQFVSNLRKEHPVVQAVVAPTRAPIEKLSQHRGYMFARTFEEKPVEAKYWLERTTQLVTKQLDCSDKHKLECAIALLADEALSWWETTTLTAPAEKISWNFFVEEFKKKCISEQYLNDRRNQFLHLKQANKPIEQYVAEFLTATEAKMKAVERRKGGHRNDKKQKHNDKSQWSSKKAKYHHDKSLAYTSTPRSQFTSKPQSVNQSSFPVMSVNSKGNSKEAPLCQYFLKQERKEYVIEEAVPNEPGPNAPRADKDKIKKHMDDMLGVGCLMLATMTPELQKQHEDMVAYEMIQNLKEIYEGQARQEKYETSIALFQCKMSEGSPVGAHVIKMICYIQTLEKLSFALNDELAIDVVLQSLPDSFNQFVLNFNMNEINKTLPQLLGMLRTAEGNMKKGGSKSVLMVREAKGKGKKVAKSNGIGKTKPKGKET